MIKNALIAIAIFWGVILTIGGLSGIVIVLGESYGPDGTLIGLAIIGTIFGGAIGVVASILEGD